MAVLAVAAAADLGYSAYRLRADLTAARSGVAQLRADLLARRPTGAVDAQLTAVRADAQRAGRQAANPLWALLARLPVLGDPARTIRGATSAVQSLATGVLPGLAAVEADLSPARLHAGHATIALSPLEQAAPTVARALARTITAVAAVQALPAHTYLASVDHARASLLTELTKFADQLAVASDALHVLPSMLGAQGPREYFMAFENDAEARGLGGLPGAYAIVRADHGHVSFVDFGNDVSLTGNFAGLHLNLGASFAARYGPGVGAEHLFVNSDASPNFPYAARIWLAMWKAQTGQQLDGAIATDPTALSYLLDVVGPTTLPNGMVITGSNVVSITESAAYAQYSNVADRKAFFLTVARAAAGDLLAHTGGRETALARALGRAIGQRRFLVYSTRPVEEEILAGEPIGGVFPRTNRPFASLVVTNAAGTKLDYYLARSLTYSAPRSCAGLRRRATITARLTNTAPATGLPPYVVVRADHPPPGTPVGQERLLVSVYATAGAYFTAATLDGQPTLLAPSVERGHPVFTVDLTLNPGQSRVLVIHLDEPVTAGAPLVIPQPLVLPEQIHLDVPTCSAPG